MLKEKGEITLGGLALKVQALTLDQLQEVMPLFYELVVSGGTIDNARTFSIAKSIISAATGKTPEEVGALPIDSPHEVVRAVNTIAVVCGLVEKKKEEDAPKPGESSIQTP